MRRLFTLVAAVVTVSVLVQPQVVHGGPVPGKLIVYSDRRCESAVVESVTFLGPGRCTLAPKSFHPFVGSFIGEVDWPTRAWTISFYRDEECFSNQLVAYEDSIRPDCRRSLDERLPSFRIKAIGIASEVAADSMTTCDAYWAEITSCGSQAGAEHWSDDQFQQCVNDARYQYPQATSCPPNNDQPTEPPTGAFALATEVEGENEAPNMLAKCMIECVKTESKAVTSDCRTVKFVRRGECHAKAAKKAEATCTRKCTHKPKEEDAVSLFGAPHAPVAPYSRESNSTNFPYMRMAAPAPIPPCVEGCVEQYTTSLQQCTAQCSDGTDYVCMQHCRDFALANRMQCQAEC